MIKGKKFKPWMIGIIILIVIIGIIGGLFLYFVLSYVETTSAYHNGVFEIKLHDLGSSPYDWVYELNKQNIVHVHLDYDNSKCPPNADGCGPDYVYTITPLKKGKVTLTFKAKSYISEYKNKVSEIIVYRITVNSDLSINETHYELF